MESRVSLNVPRQQFQQQLVNLAGPAGPDGMAVKNHRCQDIKGGSEKQNLSTAVGLVQCYVLENHLFKLTVCNQRLGQFCDPGYGGTLENSGKPGKLESTVRRHQAYVFSGSLTQKAVLIY